MAKVHITLVGGQPAPVFQGIKYSNPDKIIYICSEESKKEIENIQNTLNQIKEDSLLDYSEIEEKVVSVENVTEIETIIKDILEQENGNEISMNLSSGVKLWSMLFQQHAPESAHVYCISQNCTVLTTKGDTKDTNAQIRFSMSSQCKLLDRTLDKGYYIPYKDYTNIDQQNYEVIAELYKQPGFPELLNQMMREHNQYGNRYLEGNQFVGDDLSYIKYDSEKKEFTIKWNNKYHIQGPHATSMLLDSGWIKYAAATLLENIYKPENIYTENIYTNCILKKDKFPDISMDIMVNTGNKLIFVECQIGDTQEDKEAWEAQQNANSQKEVDEKTEAAKKIYTDILGKFTQNVRTCGGLASKLLFITLRPNQTCENICNASKRPHINYCSLYNHQGNLISSQDLKAYIDTFINQSNL